MRRLSERFFLGHTTNVAKSLLGKKLVTNVDGQKTSGMIVECEAYRMIGDEAAHSCRGRTKRTEMMFRKGGYIYVYLIYGMYFCVNVVTEKEGYGSAVLIRAIEPLEGIDIMLKRCHKTEIKGLTNGPGKLCKALGIDKGVLGENVCGSQKIWIENHQRINSKDKGISTRIGISKSVDLPWRFFIKDHPFISR